MKQKDIALIVVIAAISAIISFFVSNKLFVTTTGRNQRAAVVDPINSSFQTPDAKYFNTNSIDPTPQSQGNGDSNQNPFNGNGQ